MPSTDTISAYYSFQATQKAYANRVNNNFSNLRGHIIPINPNAASAIDNTYDLGSSSYRWKDCFINYDIYFKSATTTSLAKLSNDLTNSTGAYSFQIGGTERYNFATTIAAYNLATSTGSFVWQVASVTCAKLLSDGWSVETLPKRAYTITAAESDCGYGTYIGVSVTSGLTTAFYNLAGSTITVNGGGNRPILVMVVNDTTTAVLRGSTAPAAGFPFRVLRNNAVGIVEGYIKNFTALAGNSVTSTESSINMMGFDYFAAAGNNNYHIAVGVGSLQGTCRLRLIALELV